MKYRTLLLSLCLFVSFAASAQKDTCKIGLYVNCLYDFDMAGKSFMSDFWMWMNYKNDSLKLDDAIEIPNSKSTEFSHYSVEKKGDINWATQKCRAQIMHQWDVSKFPFDEQRLTIELEDAKYDTSQLIYVADSANSKLDCAFNSKEWRMKSFTVNGGEKSYQTTYGNPELMGSSSYPRVVAEFVIKRHNSWLMLVKMLTGAYVAFLISCFVFFISSECQDSRFGLCVGGLFAAIGNKYIVESTVPSSTINTLMDDVHNLTFAFILVIVGIIIISLSLFNSGDERKKRKSLKLDKWTFWTLIGLYTLVNVFLIWRAAH
ncbi:MAG: hypothetical protein HZB42_14350 [Sphingobacteriales bacterium]|nr:hypothetical protein [Sphingobacteriales bacterium]